MFFSFDSIFKITPELQNVTDMTDISVLKILAGWGKSLGEHANLAKSSIFGEDFYNIVRLMCID